MAHDETPAGFLSRWSRRKVEVREGRPVDDAEPTDRQAVPRATVSSPALVQEPAKPAPTLAEAQQLTPDADFTSFMARGVAPDVKNAAMKKLFADPHFNVMDGLDIYIDDYTQPDPLPLAMLRQMTSAKTLNLFEDESDKTSASNVGDNPTTDAPKVVAQSAATETLPNTEPSPHDHVDLRLQPDPAPRPEGAGSEPV